jgi:hypothetical protein
MGARINAARLMKKARAITASEASPQTDEACIHSLSDLLLFGRTAAFTTWLVIEAARLLS